MKKIMIKTSTAITKMQADDAAKLLTSAYNTATSGSTSVAYEIVFDPAAPTLEAYGQVADAVIVPNGTQKECYIAYLLAIELGVPENIARAAYLICLAS